MAEPGKIIFIPHPAVVAIVEWFVPEHKHDPTLGDLHEKTRSSLSFLLKGLEWLAFHVVGQIWPAFSTRLFLAEAVAVAAAFTGAPQGTALYIAISAVLVGLMLRDAWLYPKVGNPFDMGVDTSAALLFLLGVETVESYFMPAHALAAAFLWRGFAMCLLTVSMVRVIFRRPPGGEVFGPPSYRMTLFITVLWATASLSIKFFAPLPELFWEQDFWIGLLPFVVFGPLFRLHWDPFKSGPKTPVSIKQGHRLRELERQLGWLLKEPASGTSSVPWHLVPQVLAITTFGVPLTITLGAWAAGYLPPSRMDWLTVSTHAIAFLALTVLWIAIRKAHRDMARILKDEIRRAKTT